MNLLEIRKLCVKYGSFQVVKGVSLAVKAGEFVALTGNSGSGKSTIAHSILRLLKNASVSGEIMFKNKNLLSLSGSDFRRVCKHNISMIFQEPMTSLNPVHKVGAQIQEVLKLADLSYTKERVFELLRLVELNDVERIFSSYPHMLSGGQRQRVMIAMALAKKPDLLIADEPTTALDVTVQAEVLKLLLTLRQKLGLAILFITHDRNIVRKMADRVYELKAGQVISTKKPKQVEEGARVYHPFVKEDEVIKVNHISVFYGAFKAVDDVSFKVSAGQTLGIVGESGSGKSSLMHALLRLIPAQGEVFLNGVDFLRLKGKDLLHARSNIQMVLQDPAGSLNPRLTVRQIIEEGLLVHEKHLSSDERLEKVKKIMRQVGLNVSLLNRYPHETSGGQKTRIALARVLILNPKVLILDEVTASLDKVTQSKICDLLNALQEKLGLVYLFISHDISLVRAMSDDVIVMQKSCVVEYGPVEQVFFKPKHLYTQELIASARLEF